MIRLAVTIAVALAAACGGDPREQAEADKRAAVEAMLEAEAEMQQRAAEAETARLMAEVDRLQREREAELEKLRDLQAGVTSPPKLTARIPPDCMRYLLAVTTYLKCDQLPPAAVQSTRSSIDAMTDALRPPMSSAALVDAAAACRSGYDSLEQGAKAMGCPFDR